MVAVRGKNDPLEWHREKRNVYQDLITAFGDKGSDKANEAAYGYIDAIAVMTDTDNSGASATAWYGDIFFSEQYPPCCAPQPARRLTYTVNKNYT
jgi:hypothetical protein